MKNECKALILKVQLKSSFILSATIFTNASNDTSAVVKHITIQLMFTYCRKTMEMPCKNVFCAAIHMQKRESQGSGMGKKIARSRYVFF